MMVSLNPQRDLLIRVPATTANLGPGFDTFGLALAFYNQFYFQPAEKTTLTLAPANCIDVSGLSLLPEENLVYRAFETYFKVYQQKPPAVSIQIEGHIPLARGLGSSSSAIVAGLYAAQQWVNPPLSKEERQQELIELATQMEGHPDNVVPAITGGCRLCDGVVTYPLPWPNDWQVTVVIPDYPLLTEKARGVMPKSVPMADAVMNLRKSSVLTYALLQQDHDAFAHALEDRLHQPYRQTLIPEFQPVCEWLKAYREQGALDVLGAVISGAGPSLVLFSLKSQSNGWLSTLPDFLSDLATGQGWATIYRVLSLSVDGRGVHLREGSD